MEDLTYLRDLDPEAFEAERSRLINAEISKVPKERQKALLELQSNLDKYRSDHTSEEFLKHITSLMSERTENLEDIVQYLKNTQVKRT